jgi:hypothetical protein
VSGTSIIYYLLAAATAFNRNIWTNVGCQYDVAGALERFTIIIIIIIVVFVF